MKVKKDWWKDFFDKTYLITDARSVCDAVLTSRETDLLEEVLDLDKHDKILDLCGGQGRHSLELARRRYKDITVLDFSNYLISLGRRIARSSGLDVRFICADARFSGLKSKDYSAIFIMANSFGYFPSERENIKILREIYRLLKKGGRLLIDLADPGYLKKNLKPISWHEANSDIIVCRQRQLKGELITAREIVISKKKGLVKDDCYCEQIYDQGKITRALRKAGFKNISLKKNVSLHKNKKDYGFLTSRMFVTAVKP